MVGIFLAIVITILGLVFWVIKQYKPVAEPRMDWIEKHTTERISKLEEELRTFAPLKERVEKIEKKIGLSLSFIYKFLNHYIIKIFFMI